MAAVSNSLGSLISGFASANGKKTTNVDEASSSPVEGNLPASWYTQPAFYEFERRAIFSKRWLLTTHRLRLPEAGSYMKFQTAGYDFFLCKNRKGVIQAFHNVCRHRAYPIFDKDAPEHGKRLMLSCGYHGWSYSLDGKLAKAPQFDEVEGFNREDYNLFKIHTHVDKIGFIWVNFDSSDTPVAWEEMNGGSDEQPRLQGFNLDSYVHDHTWVVKGEYNWKLVGENYNECYHCKASHPTISKITNLDKYVVEPKKGRMEHDAPNKDDIKPEDFEFFGDATFTWHYPNAACNITTPFFYIIRLNPTSATTVTAEYQVYRNPAAPEEDFKLADEFYEQVEREDVVLCNGVQQNLNAGVYVHGPLHSKRESAVIHLKKLISQDLKTHQEQEAAAGHEIWPAQRNQQLHSQVQEQQKFAATVCACGKENGCQ